MVRELNAETQLNVMVLLDSSESMAYGEAGRTKLDYAARAVASLVTYLSKRGDFVGLTIVQGDKPAAVLPLARGELQAYRLLARARRALAQGVAGRLAAERREQVPRRRTA